MSTLFPTQFGYNPTGVAGAINISSVTIGRNVDSANEGPGFGQGGRPDYLEVLRINLTQVGNPLVKKGTIEINVDDLIGLSGPSVYNLTLREITVCQDGVSKKAVVLMSQLYT